MAMPYQVKSQFGKGGDALIAEFKDSKDATLFIHAKLSSAQNDALLANLTLNLYELFELTQSLSVADIANTSGNSDSGAGQGKGNSAGFRPTPFNTSPRPAGMPHNWVNDDEDKKK